MISKKNINPNISGLKRSPTLNCQEIISKRKQLGKAIYNWGLGANPLAPPQCVVNAFRECAQIKNYTSINGIKELNDALIKRYYTDDFTINKDDIIVGAGLKILLKDIQDAFNGDIYHVVPYWVSYSEQTKSLGKKTIEIHTNKENDFKLTALDIEKSCENNLHEAKLIIFNNPVNPTGAAYSKQELQKLAQTLVKHNFIILADEVYARNKHSGDHHSIVDYAPQNTILSCSLSKEFACGGDRLGWAVFAPELKLLRDAVAVLGTLSYSCAPVVQQYAAARALNNDDEILLYLKKSQNIFKILGQSLAAKLAAIGIETVTPQAGWYLWADFNHLKNKMNNKNIFSSQDLEKALIEDIGLVALAGSHFGMKENDLYLRMSYVDFDGSKAFACTSDEFNNEIHSIAKPLFQSIDLLDSWISGL